jgi:hypothetical protein
VKSVEQPCLTKYEREALAVIKQWKASRGSLSTKIGRFVNRPFNWAGDVVFDNPVGEAGAEAIQGIMDLLNEGACWTVRTETIYARFRSKGYKFITSSEDIHKLRLNEVDLVVGYLGTKYKALAAGEGTAAGTVGWLGMVADIPVLVGLNLRAIGEYCTYYGFNLGSQAERMFALQVLMLTSSPTDASKQAALANLGKIASDITKEKPWKGLEKRVTVRGMRKVTKALGIRLAKAKLGQIVPVMGAVIGGGFNAYYTAKTTEAAYYLYRERFLLAKCGSSIVEEGLDTTRGLPCRKAWQI